MAPLIRKRKICVFNSKQKSWNMSIHERMREILWKVNNLHEFKFEEIIDVYNNVFSLSLSLT